MNAQMLVRTEAPIIVMETAQSARESPAPAPWSLANRVLFRFAFAYFNVYNFPFPLGVIPGTKGIGDALENSWHNVVLWIGKRILPLNHPISAVSNGSGDKTFNYVQLLCEVGLALVATLVWSLMDRRRTQYSKLFAWLRLYLRYVLVFSMFLYGLSKVFRLQFGFPAPMRFAQSFGDASPMGLLWTFMGYSKPYTVFAGLAEVIGGLLVFFRRTATLGALVIMAVMTNIVMLNFCYDVPVKLYSSHLLLTSVFLLIPDMRRLANVFILNRPTEAAGFDPPPRPRWARRASLGLKFGFMAAFLLYLIPRDLERLKTYGDNAPKSPVYGLYEVEDFVRNGQAVPPSLTELKRWRKVSVGHAGVWIQTADESRQPFGMTLDLPKKTLTLSPLQDKNKKFVLTYSQPDPDHLVFTGDLWGESIVARARKVDLSKYLLLNRGFHWINEAPFNL